MTIKQLKEAIANAPDDAIFGIMSFGKDFEIEHLCPKRFLLLEQENKKLFVANNMGTHWNEKWENENQAKYIGYADKTDNFKLHLK